MTAASHSIQPNRLIHETSPYLLQHAHNPVDWYPWGPEALARAAAEDKPILLSVGYSACHWCHVMAHESFEDPDTAALMNELFVNVKVDREERPDIDAIYMEAVQAMTGRGGWPMTVFLAPDGRPFYGGTYYPPEPRYGMPSFRQLLRAIAEAWQERRREMESAGDRMADALKRSAALRPADTALAAGVLDKAAQNLMRSLDPYEGGFSDAPKFPQPMNLDFLLQNWRRTGDEKQRKAVTYTLAKMARGGIYDQLGGGFHRYSTDAHWLVPHFEKMLYDNAQLARTYLHAWQITGDPELRHVVEETLDYVLREMTARSGGTEGGFYSTQDADSEGVEGKFFVWTPDEVLALLGPDDGPLFSAYFDVTARGNFHEGGHSANILHANDDLEDAAEKLRVAEEQLAGVIARGRKILFEERKRRVHPGRDEKILAEWNGLMIHTLAEAGAVLERPDYIQAAVRGCGVHPRKADRPGGQQRSTLHASRSTAFPHLQRRPRPPERLPGGLRRGRAGVSRALRNHVRAALAGGRRRLGADDPGRIPRPRWRRLLPGERRSREVGGAAQGLYRQRDPVGQLADRGAILAAGSFCWGMTRRGTGATPRGSCG